MLEGFRTDVDTASKGMGASFAASLLMYGAFAAGVVAISAIARTVVRHEELTQVTFRNLPEVIPAPEVTPPPVAQPTQAVRRRTLAQPTEVPDRVSEAAVPPAIISDTASEGVDPGMGSLTAAPQVVEAPAPPPPPVARGPIQLPENATPPEPLSSNAMPAYPEAARASGVAATVIAKIVVEEDGSVRNIEIMRGHPAFDDEVRRVLRTWRFRPAVVEGHPTAVYRIIRIPFRLENM